MEGLKLHPDLINDLLHFIKNQKMLMFSQTFMGKNSSRKYTKYDLHLDNLFEGFRDYIIQEMMFIRMDSPYITKKKLKLTNKTYDKCINPYLKVIIFNNELPYNFYDPGVSLNKFLVVADFFNTDFKVQLRKINKCYKIARKCEQYAYISGNDDMTVLTNPRYIHYLTLVFHRYNLNIAAIRSDEHEEDFGICLEVPKDDIHDSGNS